MDIKSLLKNHAYQNIPLTFDDAYDLGQYALAGCDGNSLAQIQSVAALCALHSKATYAWTYGGGNPSLPRSAADQIAGICAAIFEHDIGKSEFGFLRPNVPFAMDNCGMGGDLLTTANVSTIAALIAAAAEIPMCKHGSPANADAGRHGSSDFVTLLGIDTFASTEAVSACVESEYFGYTEALDTRYKRIHEQTHRIALLPHMNDVIGPITNPLSPMLMDRRVLGVNHLISPKIIAEVYVALNRRGVTNLRHGLFVRGFGDTTKTGMDELSICRGGTQVAELRDETVNEYTLYASDFGLDSVRETEVSPPASLSKGEFSLRILRGEISGPPLQMVLANAALLFYLAGRSKSLRECFHFAEEIHQSGAAYEKANQVRKLLPILP